MARINVKKLVAFMAVHDHGKKEAWCHCYFDSKVQAVFTFEDHDFINKLDGFHIEKFEENARTITVGVKAPSERILAITSEGNGIVLEGGGKIDVPAEIAENFRKLL